MGSSEKSRFSVLITVGIMGGDVVSESWHINASTGLHVKAPLILLIQEKPSKQSWIVFLRDAYQRQKLSSKRGHGYDLIPPHLFFFFFIYSNLFECFPWLSAFSCGYFFSMTFAFDCDGRRVDLWFGLVFSLTSRIGINGRFALIVNRIHFIISCWLKQFFVFVIVIALPNWKTECKKNTKKQSLSICHPKSAPKFFQMSLLVLDLQKYFTASFQSMFFS